VLVDADGALTESLADEWVTHLVTDRTGLDMLDPMALEDLHAVVLDNGVGAVPEGPWSNVAAIVEFTELFAAR
jgi:hypothetical protein